MATVTSSKRHLLVTSDTYTSNGDVTVGGDLFVNGSQTTINTATLDVEDKNITLNYGGNEASSQGAGITIAGSNATLIWDEANTRWTFSDSLVITDHAKMTSGNASGKFAVKSTDVHASYDFYNDGTSYFNGAVTIDADLTITTGGITAGNITSTSNSGDASIYINSSRPTLGFTDTNSFTDANDIYIVRGSGGNKLQFQWYDNSAGSTTETFNIDNSGNATFAGTVNIVGTNSTNQESVLLRGITSNGSDLLGSIRTANTGGYNQEMRFYTSNADGTTDEDLTLTLKPDQSATFAGNIVMAANATVDGVDISGLPTSFAPTDAEANVQADWTETTTTSDAFILNKPSTFPPSSHNHDGRYPKSDVSTAADSWDSTEFSQYSFSGWDANGADWTPSTGWYWGLTLPHVSNTSSYNYSGQIVISNSTSANMYVRTISNGTENSWKQVYHEGHKPTFAEIATTPTTLAGYGITDAASSTVVNQTDFVSAANGGDFSGQIGIKNGNVWSATTQGKSTGSLHIDPEISTDHGGGAITFGASDASNGTNAQAGIYIRSDGSYGTKMYFSTTDSYATGSKAAMYINHDKDVYFLDNIDVAGNITVSGTVDGVDISALPTTFAPTDAEANVNADWNSTSGDSQILNKPTIPPNYGAHDGVYLKTNYRANWIRVGYGNSGSVRYHKLATIVVPSSFVDYNATFDWTGRYASGTAGIHVSSSNNTTAVVYGAWYEDFNPTQTLENTNGWIKYTISSDTVEIWVKTNAWREFDYIRKDSTNEASPTVTWYDENTTTDQSTEPSNLNAFTNRTHTAAGYSTATGVADNAEVNVQADWNETTTTSDAFILNKPSTFPPSTHNHDTTYLKLVGGTMNGDIDLDENRLELYENAFIEGSGGQIDIGDIDGQDAVNGIAFYLMDQKIFSMNEDGAMLKGNLEFTHNVSQTSSEDFGIFWTGWDKEGTGDNSDNAFIKHDTNQGGHSGSVLLISSMNDANDGIAFSTHASSHLRHNGHALYSEGHKPTYTELGTMAYTNLTGEPTIPSGSQLVRVLNNQDYIASGGTSGDYRDNYGAGLTIYEGYSTGANRPHTYDTTAQFMSTTGQGFELSIDWVSASTTPLKIRSLRDCCQGWNPWTNVWTSHNFTLGSGGNLDADKVDGLHAASFIRSDATDTATHKVSFTAAESIGLKGARGANTNEYIHLYNKVGIGHPSGWGQGQTDTPDKGLSTYGGMNISYGTKADSTICGSLNIGTAADTGNRYLYLHGSTANKKSRLATTNGNLHIDSADGNALYLNYYYGASTNIYFGTGNSGYCGTVSSAGVLRMAGDVVAYYSFSDRRLKTNIKKTENNLDKILSLNPVEYTWKEGPREGVKEIGLIAQEVEEVVPEVVRLQSRHHDEKTEGEEYKQVDYEHLVSTLIGAMKEQQKQIDELKSQMAMYNAKSCKCKK